LYPVSDKKTPYSELTKAIRGAGFSPNDFARDILKISYQGFRYRVNQGKLALVHYHKIMAYTGKSFEDLWPNPFQPKKRISLNLSKPDPIRLAPPKEIEEPVFPAPAPSTSDSTFKIMEVYENGISPE